MKKQLLIATFLFICSFINAQSQCKADSMYYYNSTNKVIQKNFYTYNVNGLQTENLRKDSLNGIWVNKNRTQQIFNANDKVTQRLSQIWKNNTWRNATLESYTYNLNNNLLTNVSQMWDTLTSSWILNGYNHSYVYDINNNNTKHVQSYWNTGMVSDSSKQIMTYDANGNELTNLREGWTNSNPVWRNIQLFSNSYNTNNQKDSTYNIIWNINNSSWDTSYLDTYTYNAAGNLIELINHNRIWPNWGNSIKYTYTFDSNNNRTSQNRFTWNQTSSSWQANEERTDVYNSSNLATYSLTKYYNSTAGGLVNTYQANFAYDSNDNLILAIYDNWDVNNSAWLLSSKYRYFYNCGSLSGIDEISNNYLNLYPNPTSSILNIEVKEQTQITIVNVLGDIVLKQTINGLSKIDVSNLTSGVYFIQDATSGKAIKFIKE